MSPYLASYLKLTVQWSQRDLLSLIITVRTLIIVTTMMILTFLHPLKLYILRTKYIVPGDSRLETNLSQYAIKLYLTDLEYFSTSRSKMFLSSGMLHEHT
jgi:hypothetical protein